MFKRSVLENFQQVKKRTTTNITNISVVGASKMDYSSKNMPQWYAPNNDKAVPKLKLWNSLTRSKTEFVPNKGNQITWYSCGPTVYDASHMGHARNYVTIDINRRILSDYFGYEIVFVQNVTNIDDKIIVRARQSHLYQEFIKQADTLTRRELHDQILIAVDEYLMRHLRQFSHTFEDRQLASKLLSDFTVWVKSLDIEKEKQKDPKIALHIRTVVSTLEVISSDTTTPADMIKQSQVVLAEQLDRMQGATVTDHRVFENLASFWEQKYNEDMNKLNVLPPTVTTRVSEYVPEIVTFIEKIISQGYGYSTTDGSVYFDTVKFDQSPDHVYAKLQPWNKGQQSLIEEGEGSLSTELSGKKSSNDFALWKASKPGEPAWPSPWGEGRPGWHIECSVMASEVLGSNIDVHSGGIDLAFPHHDNELAQSEACHGCKQWINYFLHTGHLHIEGQKMSKSLKNFITIQEALTKYSARQLRLAFAMQQWNSQFDFKPELSEVRSFESLLSKFFSHVRALAREDEAGYANGTKLIRKKPGKRELALYENLYETQDAVHEAFADNLSTPIALQAISDLIMKANGYIIEVNADYRSEVLCETARWVTKILKILGFNVNADGLGWANDVSGDGSSAVGDVESVAYPFVMALSKFRDQVREKAINKAPYREFLEASDKIRDEDVLQLGVSLDDRGDGRGALIKFIDEEEKAKLVQFKEEKEKIKAEKLARKMEQLKLDEQRQKEKLEKARVSPLDMFKNAPENYSAFDDSGIPTHDAQGEPLSKSMAKKLAKLHAQQTKLHEQYVKGELN